MDGCKSGWYAVRRAAADGAISTRVFASFADLVLWAPAPAIIAIDIPIGLSSTGRRACEARARALLDWPRSTSVFSTPVRQALAAVDYAGAAAAHRAVAGHGISKQAYNILPKIADVDRVVRASATDAARVFEVHPELSFAQLQNDAGDPARGILVPKRLKEGRDRRVALLAPFFGADLALALDACRAKVSQPDDIVDAFAALWSAGRISASVASSVFEDRAQIEYDVYSLPMDVHY